MYHKLWLITYERIFPEIRFESPISILEWNDWSDFRRKSENYFNVKVFSDSRRKFAQNNKQVYGVVGFPVRLNPLKYIAICCDKNSVLYIFLLQRK